MSEVTITDPHHWLFEHRLSVVAERSGRGPGYVVVALPDGRRRPVRINSTNLAGASLAREVARVDVPRITVWTLIALVQHLSANLNRLAEEVIRDEPPSSSGTRCGSPPAGTGEPVWSSCEASSAAMAGASGRDQAADCPSHRGANATNASDPCDAPDGGGSCSLP